MVHSPGGDIRFTIQFADCRGVPIS